jgi:hypothetical protein
VQENLGLFLLCVCVWITTTFACSDCCNNNNNNRWWRFGCNNRKD